MSKCDIFDSPAWHPSLDTSEHKSFSPDPFSSLSVELAARYRWMSEHVILVQPDGRKKHKTDRRDARTLRDLLWINRERFLQGKRPAKLRVVRPASADEAADRQLTVLHERLNRWRTRTINKVRTILRKRNLQHDCPTKGIQTKKARVWLESLELPPIDRLEMNVLLEQWTLVAEHITRKIKQRQTQHEVAILVGLPEAAVRESRHRVERAMVNSRFRAAAGPRRH